MNRLLYPILGLLIVIATVVQVSATRNPKAAAPQAAANTEAPRVVAEGRALAFSEMYLVTFDKSRLYTRLGWKHYEQTDYLGLPATIMIRRLGV